MVDANPENKRFAHIVECEPIAETENEKKVHFSMENSCHCELDIEFKEKRDKERIDEMKTYRMNLNRNVGVESPLI